MIVHFIARVDDVENHITTMRSIVGVIHELGHTLARDWIESAYYRSTLTPPIKPDWEYVYKDSLRAVETADVLIAETSGYSAFGVGLQVAIALKSSKPVLLLYKESEEPSSGVMAQGIKDTLVVRKSYTKSTLRKIIADFFDDYSVSTKDLRFNFMLDYQTYNHLRWKSYKLGETKAEIVRDLLQKDMEKRR